MEEDKGDAKRYLQLLMNSSVNKCGANLRINQPPVVIRICGAILVLTAL